MPKFTLKQVEETQRQMDKAEAVKKAASSTSTPKYRELPALKKNNNAKAVDLSTANTQVVPKGTQVISPSAMRNNATLSSARSDLTAITDSNANKVLNRSDNIARQKRQASLTKTGKFASEHPVLSTAYNTITAPISAIGSAVENMVGAIDGNNSNRFAIQRANIKEGAKSNINSNAGNMAYDIGTNVAEMLGSSAVGGALLSGITAGGNTSGELYNLAKENGANDRQASAYGLAGGTVGGLLQAKGIDVINNKLGASAIKGLGDVAKNVGAGALTEGLEEGLESGSQELLDSLINKDNSQRNKDYSEALSNGLSEEEARNYANKNSVSRILSSVATGAAMGGAFAGGSMALKPISKYISSKLNIPETNADNVISDAIRNSDDIPRNQIANQIDSEALPKSQSNTVNLDNELGNMSSVTNINSNKQTIEAPTNRLADGIIDSNSNYNNADNSNYKDIADSIQTNNNIANDIQTNETSDIDGTVGTEKVGMPIVNENPTNDMAESRTITNTAKRSGIYRGISQQTLDAFNKHYVEHEIDTLDAASKALDTAEKRNEFVKAVINDKEDINSNVGVDKIMLTAHDLSAQYDDAIANGDINSATKLNTQRVLLIKKLDSSVSNAGRVLQSTAKWTRHTAQGVESSAYNILNSKAKAWEKTHIRDSKRIQDLSNRLDKRFATALSEMGKDVPEANATTDVYKPTIDELKNIINEELAKESSSIRNQFNDSDIDFIANLLNEGATTRDITDFLNIKMATGTFGVKPETMKAVNDIFESIQGLDENSKEYVDAEADALRLVANDLGKSSLFDKFEAWRYLAMLGNPKTMIRNYLGNNIFGFITGTSNNLAALLESGVDKVSGGRIQRTKSVLNPISDSKLIDASRNDADTKMYRQLNGTKYSDNLKQGLSRNKDAFDSKILRKASDLVDKGISDYTAVRRKYSTSLAGWLKANGYDASIFKSKNPDDIEVLNKAREYAKAQAEYSTFHEDNAIARILTETSNKLKNEGTAGATAGHMLIEGLIPFKKTPANVLRSGVDYSPLGAVSSIAKTGKLMTGKATASDVIESWSKTLTGTGLAYLGYYLFDKGIVHINDGDTAKMDAQEGNQTYAINMNGKSYSIDWAAPGVMPLLLGAQLAKVVEETGGDIRQVFNKENGLGTILDSTGNLISPIIETSMLSGIADTMQSVSSAFNSGENAASAAVTGLANMAASYATQAIPTVGGQIARVVDPTRRSTYTDATGLDAIYKRQLNKVENKIPFLSAQNEPYIDMKGQTQNNSPFDSTLANAAYQFFSPAYIGNLQTDEGYQTTRDVYNSENANGQKIADKGALPKLETNVKIGGEKLDPQTYTEYQKVAGSTDAKIRNELAKNEVFNNLSNEQKNEVLKSVSTIASDSGKSAVSEEFTSTNKPYNIYNSGGTDALMDYFTEQFAKDDAEQHLAELGINNAKQSVIEYATEGHTDAEIKVYNEIKQYTKMKQWVPVLLKSNLTTEQKYDILLEQNNGEIPKKYKQNGTSKSDILKSYNDIVVLGK